MAWSVPTWKILRIPQSQFILGEVRAATRNGSYTSTLPFIGGTQPKTLKNKTMGEFFNKSTKGITLAIILFALLILKFAFK